MGDVELPDEVLAVGEAASVAIGTAILSGDAGEDHSQGHSLMHDPAARAQQEKLLVFARDNPELFARVLRESGNGTHRAVAAIVVGYAADKAWAARELEAAAFDADGGVRNNAAHRSEGDQPPSGRGDEGLSRAVRVFVYRLR